MSNAFDDIDDFNKEEDTSSDDNLQAKIEAFDQQVVQYSKTLLSKKAPNKERIQAAYWLGESGAPKAITSLRQIYLKEKDARLKAAAEYALGQFKAMYEMIDKRPNEQIGDALQREENAHVVELLTAITVEGKFGKRSWLPISVLSKLRLMLAGLLVILVMLNVALLLPSGDGGAEEEVLPTSALPPGVAEGSVDATALGVLDSLRQSLSNGESRVQTLQAQFAAGSSMDCTLTVTMPEEVTVPAEVESKYQNVAILSRRTSAAFIGLQGAITAYTAACGQQTPQPPDAVALQEISAGLERSASEIISIKTAINETRDFVVNSAQQEQQTAQAIVNATETASVTQPPTETPTETPTPEPTATLEPELVNMHVRVLSNHITIVMERRGAVSQLQQFFTDITQAGRTEGCREQTPTIPEDYTTEIPAEVLAIYPELETARQDVNTGLGLLREGWGLFRSACDANEFTPQTIDTGLFIATTAASAFEEATTLLNAVRNG